MDSLLATPPKSRIHSDLEVDLWLNLNKVRHRNLLLVQTRESQGSMEAKTCKNTSIFCKTFSSKSCQNQLCVKNQRQSLMFNNISMPYCLWVWHPSMRLKREMWHLQCCKLLIMRTQSNYSKTTSMTREQAKEACLSQKLYFLCLRIGHLCLAKGMMNSFKEQWSQ